ncbi:multidrug resistance-associated protein 4-like isoform X1 [Bradysia coprophila]|uniref:multidrug resistance-associated protein 4-like isoform X1 n=2 Tax=Bradysia coprophila TaxID=38358 RepID=UPI00187D81B8|nr:multidrug resistance-associated protein 4-like isoform X1 [Bradysia coprophila]
MESTRKTLPPNPREHSNIFSILTFTWTIPLFKRGYTKILELDDIFQPLNADRSSLLGDRLEKNWEIQLTKRKRPSLLAAILKTFRKELCVFSGICFFNELIARLGQPLLLGYLLLYFRDNSTITFEKAIWYSCGLLLFNALQALSTNQFYMTGFHMGMKVRVAVCSVIYRKALRLSQTALGDTAPGKVVNLLSNDVNRFEWVSILINSMWTGPLVSIVVAVLLYMEIGYAGLVGIGVIFIVVPIQSYTMTLTSKFRAQTALRTDQRIRFMDEIISGVHVIKMYAWELPFSHLVAVARRLELKIIRKTSFVRGLYMTFVLFTTRVAVFCTMLAIVILYGAHEITAEKVFVMSLYYTIIALTMNQLFVRGIAEIAEVLVALRRLQHFMELEEKQTESITELLSDTNVAVSTKNAYATWKMPSNSSSQHKTKQQREADEKETFYKAASPTLSNINVEFPRGKLIGVIGPVGAGKSSFLQILLRELPLDSGTLRINGSISYANQEPWVFAASVRQNILFGNDYDHNRYNDIVKCCALRPDFEQFENGDLSIVGEKGSLSGGQKARINLARTCYRNADIYLLDDPLSAVDAHVGAHLFNKCIGPGGYLARTNKTRILVTHQVHFLKDADWIVMLNDGKIEVQGTQSDLANSGIDFAKLIGGSTEKAADKTVGQITRQSSTTSVASNKTSQSDSENEGDGKVGGKDEGLQMEETSKGKVKGSVAWNYFSAGGHWMILIVLALSFLIVQVFVSGADYWVFVWVRQEQLRASTQQADGIESGLSTELCIYVSAALVGSIFVFGIMRSLGFYEICMRASQNICNSMFNGIISTKLRFFDTNPSGRILNRFSKDIGTVDEGLPKAIMDGTQSILTLLGSIVITATVNVYFLIPILVMGAIFMFIRKIYLKTSKNIKRIEGIAKSPAFTHLSATLSGLSTVRAFNAEDLLQSEFDNHQDTHSACWYMFVSAGSAFGFSLDILCWIFVACIICFYLVFDAGASSETVGLALTQVLSMTGLLQWGVRQSAEILNLMTSVERSLEYRDLEPELQPEKPQEVGKSWPADGSIEFRNVFYKYFETAEPVLRNLSFIIKSREKIGIVGRTGAGKSSLIGAIFRLACIEGKVLIDGVDTGSIRLQDLRKRVAIIPQDPVLFSGTLRRNLDPFEEYPDDEIWSALEKVELKDSAAGVAGLQSQVLARGANYSVGQRQLLCLARSILRKNRILLMDEATANVDPQTDALIQQTIREKFANCTVITVAHRLNTIIDSDRVLVMDAGQAAEFDEPYILLQNKTGIFHGMVEALGTNEFEKLSLIADNKFKCDHGKKEA